MKFLSPSKLKKQKTLPKKSHYKEDSNQPPKSNSTLDPLMLANISDLNFWSKEFPQVSNESIDASKMDQNLLESLLTNQTQSESDKLSPNDISLNNKDLKSILKDTTLEKKWLPLVDSNSSVDKLHVQFSDQGRNDNNCMVLNNNSDNVYLYLDKLLSLFTNAVQSIKGNYETYLIIHHSINQWVTTKDNDKENSRAKIDKWMITSNTTNSKWNPSVYYKNLVENKDYLDEVYTMTKDKVSEFISKHFDDFILLPRGEAIIDIVTSRQDLIKLLEFNATISDFWLLAPKNSILMILQLVKLIPHSFYIIFSTNEGNNYYPKTFSRENNCHIIYKNYTSIGEVHDFIQYITLLEGLIINLILIKNRIIIC